MAIKPIGLSFKNTGEDIMLYEWICSHSNLSGFIKDILRKEMLQEKDKSKGSKKDKKGISIDF